LNILKDLKNINAQLLSYGLKQGFVSKNEVFEWCEIQYTKEDCPIFIQDAVISGTVNAIEKGVGGPINNEGYLEAYLLASLIALNESKLELNKKVDSLQEMYSLYMYPDVMSSCSIYSQDNIDPLEGMVKAIKQLKQENK
jgi:hypothetical protein